MPFIQKIGLLLAILAIAVGVFPYVHFGLFLYRSRTKRLPMPGDFRSAEEFLDFFVQIINAPVTRNMLGTFYSCSLIFGGLYVVSGLLFYCLPPWVYAWGYRMHRPKFFICSGLLAICISMLSMKLESFLRKKLEGFLKQKAGHLDP